MARIKKKYKDVAKFGGTETLGKVHIPGALGEQVLHEASTVETQSKTSLESDKGEGDSVIIRCFTFGINPEVFLKQRPTKQDLFNAHIGPIENWLFRDGLTLFVEVPPRLIFDVNKMQYQIFVAARPRKGYLLQEKPQTLSEIAHG